MLVITTKDDLNDPDAPFEGVSIHHLHHRTKETILMASNILHLDTTIGDLMIGTVKFVDVKYKIFKNKYTMPMTEIMYSSYAHMLNQVNSDLND